MTTKYKKMPFWLEYLILVLIAFILIAIMSLIGIWILKVTWTKNDTIETYNPVVIQEKQEENYIYENSSFLDKDNEEFVQQEEPEGKSENIEDVEENVVVESNETEILASSYINGVPYINQDNLGYPTGCEAVAAAMAAKYTGYNVTIEDIIANTPTDELGKRQVNGVWIAENPFKYFVGYPTKTKYQGSYGCFADPIEKSLKALEIQCNNISGCTIETLYNYISEGKPIIIWCRAGGKLIEEGVTWKYPDGSGEFVELVGEHCAVLVGYDEKNVYLNDPAIGKGVSQSKEIFESNWYKLYRQAIIIE